MASGSLKRVQDASNTRLSHFYKEDGSYDGYEWDLVGLDITAETPEQFGQIVHALTTEETDG